MPKVGVPDVLYYFDQRFTHVTFLFCRQSPKFAINLKRIKSGLRKNWVLRVTEPLVKIVQYQDRRLVSPVSPDIKTG